MCLTHARSPREVRQVGLVLLKVVQTVHMLDVHLQLPEVLGQDPRPRVQDAPQVGFGQLLPLVQRHRAWSEQEWQGGRKKEKERE